MAEGVERFEVSEPEERGGPLHPYVETPMDSDPQGDWVRYSDYESLDASYADMKRARAIALRERDNAREKRDQARNQERQRIQEALEGLAAEFTDRSRVRPGETDESMGEKIAYEEAAREVRDKAVSLDTLDPSGEEERFLEPPEDLYREIPHPSGEQGEEKRSLTPEMEADLERWEAEDASRA